MAPETLKTLIGVLIHKTPLLPVPALSLLGAGRLIAFGAVLTSKLFSYRLAGLLSLILGKVLFSGSTS